MVDKKFNFGEKKFPHHNLRGENTFSALSKLPTCRGCLLISSLLIHIHIFLCIEFKRMKGKVINSMVKREKKREKKIKEREREKEKKREKERE